MNISPRKRAFKDILNQTEIRDSERGEIFTALFKLIQTDTNDTEATFESDLTYLQEILEMYYVNIQIGNILLVL